MLKIKSFFWVNGLFFILLGGLLFFLPETAFRVAVIVFAVETLLSGIFGSIAAWQQREYCYRGLLFFGAVLQIIFWILLLIFPGIGERMVKIVIILLGISVLIKGVWTIFDGFRAREMQIRTWWVLMVMGSLAILLGIFLISNAFLSFLALTIVFGLGMVIFGIVLLVIGFQVKSIEANIGREE